MDNRLTKIRFREDTAANWKIANPVLSSAEPGYEIDTGLFKIGDGKTTWLDLPYKTSKDVFTDVPQDGLMYVRTYAVDAKMGTWTLIPSYLKDIDDAANVYGRRNNEWVKLDYFATKFQKDNLTFDLETVYNSIPKQTKSILDLYKLPYNNELDFESQHIDADGKTYGIYGIKQQVKITSPENTPVTTQINVGINKLLQINGMYETGLNGEMTAIDSNNVIFNTETKTLTILTTSKHARTDCILDVIYIFAREL